jgi:hypothetical protein
MSNTTTAQQYAANKAARYARLLAKLSKMDAPQIKTELRKMHDKAHALPKREQWESDMLHSMANGAENHFYLILNPDQATPENIQWANNHGKPVPQFA